MPLRYYPKFSKIPRSLLEKKELVELNYTCQYDVNLERVDYLDATDSTTGPETRYRRLRWKSRKDYLFMLIFVNISFQDILMGTELSMKYGGYVLVIYALIHLTMTFVFVYLLIFLSVYTKKSILNLGKMLPICTGFGYSLIVFAVLGFVSKMRLLCNFFVFMYYALIDDFKSCSTYKSPQHLGVTPICVTLRNKFLLKPTEGKKECVHLPRSLYITCGGKDEYILATSKVTELVYTNIEMKYFASMLGVSFYVVMMVLIKKRMPAFVKCAKVVAILMCISHLFVIFTVSLFFEGWEPTMPSLWNLSELPTANGAFQAIAMSLPKLGELYVKIVAVTGRLPLCTVPAVDTTLVIVIDVIFTALITIANLMATGVLCNAYGISLAAVTPSYVPLNTMPYFMGLMPINGQIWILLYFLIHSAYSFVELLAIMEAINVNILWQHGLNKIILNVIHIFAFVFHVYIFLLPDTDDINSFFLQNVSVNLPELTIFSFVLVIYGVSRLEEDIAFMTTSPPAEILIRLVRLLPFVCVGLIIWCRMFVFDILDTIVQFGVLVGTLLEMILRFVFFRGSGVETESQIQPKPTYGPPNLNLRIERKEYKLETRKMMQSNVNRVIFEFQKVSNDESTIHSSQISDQISYVSSKKERHPSDIGDRSSKSFNTT